MERVGEGLQIARGIDHPLGLDQALAPLCGSGEHVQGQVHGVAQPVLLGEIDEEATGNGVIVCKDGFRATTFSPDDFLALAANLGLAVEVFEVDESSVFCEIIRPL